MEEIFFSIFVIYLICNFVQAGKKAAILGVLDSKLSAAINEATGIKCSDIGASEVGSSNIFFIKLLLL